MGTMIGQDLLLNLRQTLEEAADSGWMDDRTSYTYLLEAATKFVQATHALKASKTITTVAGQQAYPLPADFLALYAKDPDNRKYIQYISGSNTYPVLSKEYEDLIYENVTASVLIPNEFVLKDSDLTAQFTGTATSNNTVTSGACQLIDTAAAFTSVANPVSKGDSVVNSTDGSSGVVLEINSGTEVKAAMFGGTNNDWSINDNYTIVPQPKMEILLVPPPATVSDTFVVHYIQKPAPVFSDLGLYRFDSMFVDAIIKYAAFLYKYRDASPNFGDAWYVQWERSLRLGADTYNRRLNRRKLKVNFMKR